MNLRAKRERVIDIIKTHGHQMTEQQLDKALDAWDGLVKSSLNSSSPVHHNNQDNKKEKPVETITKAQINAADTELDQLQKAEKPRQPWFQNNRYFDPNAKPTSPAAAPQRTAPTAPAPNMAQNLRESRINISQLDGHSQAALRQGVDLDRLPAGTDLTKLNLNQMASLARQQTLDSTEPMFRASGKLYRR